MKVRKDRQFLVFDFEDGNTVKYDFATKTCIGKKGAPVTNLKTQLRGMSIKELIDCCEDSKYANFLRFIKHKEQNKGRYINNETHFSRPRSAYSTFAHPALDGAYLGASR